MEKKYVLDTSAVIEKAITNLAEKKEIEGTILIPNAVVAELENQANKGLEIGFIGLEELQEIRKIKFLNLKFVGDRPTEHQIRLAKSGEIDAYIRELAYQEKAILITGDKVQAESAKVFGLKVIHLEREPIKEKLEFEKYFDDKTMSIHIKENTHVYAKRGKPGAWKLTKVSKSKLSQKEIENIAKEVIEKSRIDTKTFIEISRRGSTIVQSNKFRVVIVKPPVSDGWEITIVRPITKLNLNDYNLPKDLLDRLEESAKGIIIAGEPGSGKSTIAQALAEFYLAKGKIVKTVESPRDLQLDDKITQYSKNFASGEEIHDILFLSRPDYIVFDEMRDSPDFRLYSDLRLAGSECIGVVHSSTAIDAVQRFITRLDLGLIPSIIDTVLFIEKGSLGKILSLNLIVKVPSGMTESDLARPVVEVRDFETGKLEYEIYSYGEQTVVIQVEETKKTGLQNLARIAIEKELKKYCRECKAEIISGSRIRICIPEADIARVIGKDGKTIAEIEKKLGVSIDVKELRSKKENLKYEVQEDKKVLRFFIEPGTEVEILIDDKLIMTGYSSKKGEVKVHKQSQVGRQILNALKKNQKVELKG